MGLSSKVVRSTVLGGIDYALCSAKRQGCCLRTETAQCVIQEGWMKQSGPVGRFFQFRLSVGSVRGSWINAIPKHDHTLISLDDTTQNTQNTWTTYFPQCNNIAIAHSKCDTKDTLCDDNDDTCAIMCETLEMNAEHVYMIITTQYHKDFPSKQTKTPLYTICDNSHAKRWHLLVENNVEILNNKHIFNRDYPDQVLLRNTYTIHKLLYVDHQYSRINNNKTSRAFTH